MNTVVVVKAETGLQFLLSSRKRKIEPAAAFLLSFSLWPDSCELGGHQVAGKLHEAIIQHAHACILLPRASLRPGQLAKSGIFAS